MKDSTKEYLMAGAGFVGGLVKALVAGTAYTAGGVYSARSTQEHWDKARSLQKRERALQEREGCSAIPVGGAFLLPYRYFKDSNGNYVDGGTWRLRKDDGWRLLLYKQETQSDEQWFCWTDIREYYNPSL